MLREFDRIFTILAGIVIGTRKIEFPFSLIVDQS